jgi:hypothetical protein
MQTNADLDQKHCLLPYKLAGLRFADRDTNKFYGFVICGLGHQGICGFVICGLIITISRICNL